MNPRKRLAMTAIVVTLAGCGPVRVSNFLPGPTAVPGASGDPGPTTVAQFVVTVPQPAPGGLELEVVDPVTGIGVQPAIVHMSAEADGRYRAQLTVLAGSLLRYRYRLAQGASEATTSGAPIRYRVGHVPAPTLFEDIVAAWDGSGSQGETGRILGQLTDANTAAPLPEMIVTAGGVQTFTDIEGRFRLERLPIGLQNLVAYDPTGAYRPAQQGAVIAADGTTPAQLAMQAAPQVTVTFELTSPAAAHQPPRVVGNISQFGDTFGELAGGAEISGARAPEMVRVDDTHFLMLTSLGAGTDLRYKYTLGDGLWNAERAADGAFFTRQWIVPEVEAVRQDQVAAWGDRASPVGLILLPPANTAADDQVTLQFNPFTWYAPLPVAAGDGQLLFQLYGPLPPDGSLRLRACRNFVCQPEDGGGQSLAVAESASATIQLDDWGSWSEPAGDTTVIAPEIQPRPDFEVGVELLPQHEPAWLIGDDLVMGRVAGLGANTVSLTPTWHAAARGGLPRFEFDPAGSRRLDEIARQAELAQAHGLSVVLRPELLAEQGTLDDWWRLAGRDPIWWEVFYEELQSFLLTQAAAAGRIGAERLVITGHQLAPSLPDGQLPDGSASGAPLVAESRWRQILDRMRTAYSGPIAFEIAVGNTVSAVPQFLDIFDQVQVYWHAPLASGRDDAVEMMAQEAARLLDFELQPVLPQSMPVVVSLEYASVDGGGASCPPRPDGTCRPVAEFDLGAIPDPDLATNLQSQARALNAMLLEVSEREWIAGVTIRRTFPLLSLQDQSASVYGKPAAEVIGYWYPQLRGQVGP